MTYNPNTDGYTPGRKAFEVHELRRIPVILSEEAKTEIDASSSEGRKFPQALSEYFGGYLSIKEVRVHAVVRSTHFAVTPDDFHPVTGRENRLLEIDIVHVDESVDPHRFLINADDLHEVYRGGMLGFRAHTAARHLVEAAPAHFKEVSHAERI